MRSGTHTLLVLVRHEGRVCALMPPVAEPRVPVVIAWRSTIWSLREVLNVDVVDAMATRAAKAYGRLGELAQCASVSLSQASGVVGRHWAVRLEM